MPSPGLTAEQQLEYDVFIRNNPGDEGRASSALGFAVPAGTQVWSASNDPGNWDVAAARGEEAPGVREMIDQDRGSWEGRLRNYAARKGVSYDQTMLDDVIRQITYARNVGKNPDEFLRNAERTIDQRATNTPGALVGGPSGGPGGPGGLGSSGGSSGDGGGAAGTGATTTSGLAGQSMASLSAVSSAPNPIQPFTEQFSYPDFVAPDQRAPSYPGFTAPTVDEARQDPGWQFRLKEALQALERSAAAKGSYLTPNTMQGLMEISQGMAGDEYGNVYGRRFNEWGTGYDRLVGEDETAFGRGLTTYGTNRGNQKDLFDTRRDIWETNEGNRFGSGRTNRMDDLSILTGNRQYALGSRGLDLQALAGDRNYALGNRGLDLSNRQFEFGSDLANRQFDFGRDQDAWSRRRSGYLDDFGMWHARDRARADDIYRMGQLGRPD